ncbi:hypothetical protein J2755_001238 [Methanohalophilus levihalophilus]|uniref:hypothetical protein n=1 Tax=Methanohalophilus levihalophilus TaxID=1431282 RepID=UPI001AEB847A|nr:hypothetical protein [Methanohalophilus levihalophilus]MBP2030304.1 hypothetical protein [Methanohalophilus levihalophilus]
MAIEKNKFQLISLASFLLAYLILGNAWLYLSGNFTPVYLPGTLIIGLAGYFAGGLVYDRLYRNSE